MLCMLCIGQIWIGHIFWRRVVPLELIGPLIQLTGGSAFAQSFFAAADLGDSIMQMLSPQ